MRPIGRKRAGERTPFVNLACVGMATERAHGGIDKGRTADLIVPGFDEAVRRLSLAPLQRRRLILPISIRSALLAAVSIVVDRGPDTIEVLARATIGGISGPVRQDCLAAAGRNSHSASRLTIAAIVRRKPKFVSPS